MNDREELLNGPDNSYPWREGAPLLIDLFCGAGGCSVGFYRAGFNVVGVDIKKQRRYPFEFLQMDALEWLRDMLAEGWFKHKFWGHRAGVAVIHASPPCPRWSTFSRNIGTSQNHPDLITPLRPLLKEAGVPYSIENVVGAPLIDPIRLCGSSFGLKTKTGLGLRRHRLFESTFTLWGSQCAHGWEKDSIGVFGNGTPQWFRKKHGRNATKEEWAEAMGIDWMTRDELADAIPPAYTEYLGKQMLEQLAKVA